jgi:ADP-heptose:LPS heptosyltransferase
LVPASNMHIKRWPTHAWVRLSGALRDAGCVPLVLLPPGRDPLERALEATPVPPLIVRAPLDRAAALLARCDLVVGVDTGLLHLAAALGTRYVGLFGPTNPLVTGPYDGSLGTTLVAPVEKTDDCASCWRQFKYVEDHCQAMPAGSCMAALSVESVLDACTVELARLSSAA